MHIISWNVNSIRAMVRKLPKASLAGFMKLHNADIYCFQETKISEEQLEPTLHFIEGYESFWSFSKTKKGYSGVATYARNDITLAAETSLGEQRFDDEGRMIMTDHHSFVLFNVYFPNAGGTEERLNYKLDFYAKFQERCEELRKQGRNVVVVGDVNTAYEDTDLWNPQGYKDKPLFVNERQWMKQWYESGFVDALRILYPGKSGYYSWFDPLEKDNRRLNRGWRLDYTILNREFCDSDLVDAGVMTTKSTEDDNLSDHIPICILIKEERYKKRPPVPPHQPPKLSSLLVQKKRPTIKSFFAAKQANTITPTTTTTTSSTVNDTTIATSSVDTSSSSAGITTETKTPTIAEKSELKPLKLVDKGNTKGTKNKSTSKQDKDKGNKRRRT